MPIREGSIETSHATLAVRESSGSGTPVLMIHGNSSSGAVFRNQIEGAVGQRHRLIAPDLPGHGDSSDAIEPDRSYSMEGYADAMAELLRLLGVERAIVFGWSLGGHIGLELIAHFPGMLGLMITGTPPISGADALKGFLTTPHMNLAGKQDFTEQDVDDYARATCGGPFEPFLRDVVARTDGRARRLMVEKFVAGSGVDQAGLVATAKVPLAVVNGLDEPFVNLEYVRSVRYASLWQGRPIEIPGSGHAPFWDAPARFDPIFEQFLADVDR